MINSVNKPSNKLLESVPVPLRYVECVKSQKNKKTWVREQLFHHGVDDIAVQATIHTLGGFSAHASQSQLVDWVSHFKTPHPKLYLVHGETETKSTFQKHLAGVGWSAEIPHEGESITF